MNPKHDFLRDRLTRRNMMINGAVVGGAFLAGGVGRPVLGADAPGTRPVNSPDQPSPGAEIPGADAPRENSLIDPNKKYSDTVWDVPGVPGKDYTPVVCPNVQTLPFKIVDGVKVFHLIAGEFEHYFVPPDRDPRGQGLRAKVWGYNGGTPGPTIEAVEGDRIRIYVTNTLPEPTSVHWHGLLLPSAMDGVSGLSQKPTDPGKTCKYEFTVRQHGTHMYHAHFDEMVQIGLGMMGMFIIHPRKPRPKDRRIDRDFALIVAEFRVDIGTSRPNPGEMTDFNILTINGKSFPGTDPLIAKLGDRVRMRFINLSAQDHHPLHLHGYQFKIVETDGGPIPESAQWPETTVLTPVGSSRAIEFVADEPGDWAFHCHMNHHIMNQMGHENLQNMIGMDPGDLDEAVNSLKARTRDLVPAYMRGPRAEEGGTYMTMGQDGMGGMVEHMQHMPIPKNSIPMLGAAGPFSYIDMGGMFTILKVHPDLKSYDDPGWYKNPPGTVADDASAEDLKRDGMEADIRAALTAQQAARAAGNQLPLVSPGGHGGH